MYLLTISLVGFLLVLPTKELPNSQFSPRQSHGTVNIFFANQNGLVAVTDKMITTGDKHEPVGNKMFQIDATTICTMAGLYRNTEIFSDLALLVPNVMVDYMGREQSLTRASKQPVSFDIKFESLITLFQFELEGSLQAFIALHPKIAIDKDMWKIVLTLAGYDPDGFLKIAQVTLTPEISVRSEVHYRPSLDLLHNYIPKCELTAHVEENPYPAASFPAPRIVGNALYCVLAGLSDVAESRLKDPLQFPKLPQLQNFFIAQRDNRPLSVAEMKALALELEDETAKDEEAKKKFRVGGDPDVAVLERGVVSSAPALPFAHENVGRGLRTTHITHWNSTCGGSPMESRGLVSSYKSFIQAQGRFVNCGQILDGLLFHDSLFEGGKMFYLGGGPLLFSDSNQIQDTDLWLHPSVNLESPTVHHLLCNFKWKSVTQGEHQARFSCSTNP